MVLDHRPAYRDLVGGGLSIELANFSSAPPHYRWPLDEAWYEGRVTDYDRLRVRHTVTYDDGDVEIIALWEPGQRLQVRDGY
jgi:hypothetical protein